MLRRTGCEVAAMEQFNQPGSELPRAAVRRMADLGTAEHRVREPAHRDNPTTVSECANERKAGRDLCPARRPVRGDRAGMCRNDVPQQYRLLHSELGEHAVDDGRGRLRRAGAGQLPLGREGDARDAGAAISGCLPDEKNRSVTVRFEVGRQPLAAQPRAAVLVEGLPDPGGLEPGDESLSS